MPARDCFVAALLAMTSLCWISTPEVVIGPQRSNLGTREKDARRAPRQIDFRLHSHRSSNQLTAAMAQELDKEKRQKLINEAARIAQDDVATIPLHQQVIVWAARDGVEVVQPADNAFYLRWATVK